MTQLVDDIRYALRMQAKNRLFTAAILLILAVAVGANTAVFSAAQIVFIHSLPFPGSERLMLIMERQHDSVMVASYPNFNDWRQQARSFESMAGYRAGNLTLTGNQGAERIGVKFVSSDFLRTLGVSLTTGRDFTAEDDQPGAPPVAIVSAEFWQRRFPGDSSIVGRKLRLSEQSVTAPRSNRERNCRAALLAQ